MVDNKELLERAYQSILDMEEDDAAEVLELALESKMDLKELLEKGYSAGMTELGELFGSGEIFLPDLIIAAEIMQDVSSKIEECLLADGEVQQKKGKVVFATVHGDVHDIGKGICCSMLKTNGIEVVDLGRDVPAEEIVEKAEETHADIIAMSSLLTTSMPVQQKVMEILNEKGIRDKYYVMVGGAPVTVRWSKKIGADIYTEDGTECAKAALAYLIQSN